MDDFPAALAKVAAWRKANGHPPLTPELIVVLERMVELKQEEEGVIPPEINPVTRDAVLACPDRGSTIPPDPNAGCCGGGPELTVCRAGKGAIPGKVTLRECLSCKSATA